MQNHSLIFVTLAMALAACLLTGSAAAEEKVGIHEIKDLVYGKVEGAGLLADVAYPDGAGPFPAIISVHGGRWKGGHRNDASSIKVGQWAGFGFFAMTIDYRLVGCTPAPACYQDMLCAIRWVHAHAGQYHIDPKRIFLIGQSAGGHMVALAGTLGEGPFKRTGGWDKESSDFRGVISVAGPYELVPLDWGKIWTPAGEDPDTARRLASPIVHVNAKIKPLLVIHSDDDRSVPIKQALDMAETLDKAKARFKFVHYKDKGHMGITDDVIKEARAFIENVSASNEAEKNEK